MRSIIAAFLTASIVATPALADLVTSIASGSMVRQVRGRNPVVGFNNLIIGAGAAQSLWDGSCNIVVGHDDVPAPDTSYYLNVDGTIFPNSARWDPEFQSLIRHRAFDLAREMGIAIEPAMIDLYFARGFCVSGTDIY